MIHEFKRKLWENDTQVWTLQYIEHCSILKIAILFAWYNKKLYQMQYIEHCNILESDTQAWCLAGLVDLWEFAQHVRILVWYLITLLSVSMLLSDYMLKSNMITYNIWYVQVKYGVFTMLESNMIAYLFALTVCVISDYYWITCLTDYYLLDYLY